MKGKSGKSLLPLFYLMNTFNKQIDIALDTLADFSWEKCKDLPSEDVIDIFECVVSIRHHLEFCKEKFYEIQKVSKA